jgi:hypothetical protein
MAVHFAIGESDEVIEFRFKGAEESRLRTGSDGNFNSTINVNIGAFSGAFQSLLIPQELSTFYNRLNDVLKAHRGTVSFGNAARDISIAINCSEPGQRARVTGAVKPQRRRQSELHFDFDISQYDLSLALEKLYDTLQEFRITEEVPEAT